MVLTLVDLPWSLCMGAEPWILEASDSAVSRPLLPFLSTALASQKSDMALQISPKLAPGLHYSILYRPRAWKPSATVICRLAASDFYGPSKRVEGDHKASPADCLWVGSHSDKDPLQSSRLEGSHKTNLILTLSLPL